MILLRFQGGMNLLGFAGGYEFTVTYRHLLSFGEITADTPDLCSVWHFAVKQFSSFILVLGTTR